MLEGIAVGVGASVFAILYRIGRPRISVLGHVHGTRSFRAVGRDSRARRVEGILLLRVDASFSFMNAEYLRDVILDSTAKASPGVEAVVIDASSINDLDTTAAHVLIGVARTLEERGIELYMGGARSRVQKVLERSGFGDSPGLERFHMSPHRAVRYALARRGDSGDYLRNVPGEGPRGTGTP
jgi:SulP family sulfate permease